MRGFPCRNCFNNKLWDSSVATKEYTPEQVAENIIKYAPNKYITISGGEPTDQIEELIELCKILKSNGFHILVYTWRSINELFSKDDFILNLYEEKHIEGKTMKSNMIKLFRYIDILIDGEFIEELKFYNEDCHDGFLNSIGSSNQTLWHIKDKKIYGYKSKYIKNIKLYKNNELVIRYK